jgi:hypothetical protein
MKTRSYPLSLPKRVENLEKITLKLHDGLNEFAEGVFERIQRLELVLGSAKAEDLGSSTYYIVRSIEKKEKYPYELRKLVEGQLVLIDAFDTKEAAVDFYNNKIKDET